MVGRTVGGLVERASGAWGRGGGGGIFEGILLNRRWKVLVPFGAA